MIKKFCPCCLKDNSLIALTFNKKSTKFISLSNERYEGYLQKITRPGDINIRKCLFCGHHWYQWLPKEDLLIKMYDFHVRKNKIVRNYILKKKENYIYQELTLLRKFFKNQKVNFLDYGSGLGSWVNIADKLNLETYAFEPSVKRSDKSGIKVVGNLKDFKNVTFDIINLEQVLEHIVNPRKILINLSKYSRADTIYRIRVPNISRCKEGKNFYKEWPYNGKNTHTLSPYEHVQGFTQKSLLKLSNNSGLKIHWKFIIFSKPNIALRIFLGLFFKSFSTTEIYLKKI